MDHTWTLLCQGQRTRTATNTRHHCLLFFSVKGPGCGEHTLTVNTPSKHKTLPYSYFLLTGPGVAGTALLAALVNFDTTRVSARFSDFNFSFSDFNFCSCCKTLNYSKAKNISIFAIPSLHVSFSKQRLFFRKKNTNITKTNKKERRIFRVAIPFFRLSLTFSSSSISPSFFSKTFFSLFSMSDTEFLANTCKI